MNKWLIVAVFVLLVLTSAMGLKSLTTHSAVANSGNAMTASPSLTAIGGGPAPIRPPSLTAIGGGPAPIRPPAQ